MIKKIFFVFALALTLQLITGCVDCNCGPIKDVYYTTSGLSAKHMDTALPWPMITNDSIIASAKYGIYIEMQLKYLSLKKQRINWGLIQTAQACSCADPNFIPKEDVVSLAIFSDYDFDASHPKNTDLSSYFKVRSNNDNTMMTIVDHLRSYKNTPYTSITAKIPFYNGIFLQVAPSSSKRHKFRLKITLSDGTVYGAETTEVELK